MEKILRRLAWFVSLTALIGFGFPAIFNIDKENNSHKKVIHYINEQNNAQNACYKDKSKCNPPFFIEKLIELNVKIQVDADYLSKIFTALALIIPTTTWFLFFSFRWVLTGRKPWQHKITLQKTINY